MYKLKYTKLTDNQIKKLKIMAIENSDSKTNEKKWVKSAKRRADLDLKTAEQAIGLFLHAR